MKCAETILEQLGGNRFTTMTGAKNLLSIENGLQFALPSRFAKRGINRVRITLNERDLYDLRFYRMGRYGIDAKVIADAHDICVEHLRYTFTAYTGLRCSL